MPRFSTKQRTNLYIYSLNSGGNKILYIVKQACSYGLQVYLRNHNILLPTWLALQTILQLDRHPDITITKIF